MPRTPGYSSPLPTSSLWSEKWGWQDETFIPNIADNQPTSCHSINKGTEYKPENREKLVGYYYKNWSKLKYSSNKGMVHLRHLGKSLTKSDLTNKGYNSNYNRWSSSDCSIFSQKETDWTFCPETCRCTWSGGKRSAECQVNILVLFSKMNLLNLIGIQIWETLSIPTARKNTESYSK